jgi:hypothetical protein
VEVGNPQADCQADGLSTFLTRPTLPVSSLAPAPRDASSPTPPPDASQNLDPSSQPPETKSFKPPQKTTHESAPLRPTEPIAPLDTSRVTPTILPPRINHALGNSPDTSPPPFAHLTTLARRPYDEISQTNCCGAAFCVAPCTQNDT